ncbi:major facilitator superfamily domain-containing protein 6-like [Colius striatus]|uniref:major facilitator superfamily domain-containing protein 6-like n=1 Tax=Colius striatus TaxID=57412 RepID=UPI002B1E68F0|nr:major facilitator superfamily domain-containing protein 6-like [Colius striatus]
MSERWDVGRTLALSGLFRLLQGAGSACAGPFLTLYLRHLGLSPALVGVAAGAKHLAAALWAAIGFCPKGRGKRRVLVALALLGSAVASLLLSLIPAAGGAAGDGRCNAAALPAPGAASGRVLSTSAVTETKAVSKERVEATADVLTESRKAALTSSAFPESLGQIDTLGEKSRGAGEGDTKTNGSSDGLSGWTPVKAVNWETQNSEMPFSSRPVIHGLEEKASSLGSAAIDPTEESLRASESKERLLFKTTVPALEGAYVSGNLSDHQQDTQDVSFKRRQNIFQTFLMVLGTVVLWELLATFVKQTVNEGLYEYLDFVDATDRYSKLWICSYLGEAAGACSIAAFVDQMSCFLGGRISRLAVHFYGYALLTTLSLFVSVFFPIHVPKKTTNRVNKTAKALTLLWGDGRAILCALTVFLTGAAAAAVHNFLFWQMQDRGSSELYMGLFVAIGLLAEICLHFFKEKLLKALSSSKIVAISLSLLAAQLLCYSFLWTVWSVLLIQLLSAFSSGALWWVVGMSVDDIATPGMERSLCAVLRGLCHSGGASLGSFAGGFVVKHFGLAVLYRACSVCLMLWLFLFLFVQSKLPRQKKINYSRLLADNSSDTSDSDKEDESGW